jgi:hypothetical protein
MLRDRKSNDMEVNVLLVELMAGGLCDNAIAFRGKNKNILIPHMRYSIFSYLKCLQPLITFALHIKSALTLESESSLTGGERSYKTRSALNNS